MIPFVNCLENCNDTNYTVNFAVNPTETVDGEVCDGESFDVGDGTVYEAVRLPKAKLFLREPSVPFRDKPHCARFW